MVSHLLTKANQRGVEASEGIRERERDSQEAALYEGGCTIDMRQ